MEEEQLSSHSKTKKPTKYGKKIVKKSSSRSNGATKLQKNSRVRKHNYSPIYKREKQAPLYHSDDYKPSISEQDET
jgi:membrane protein involved in colicin uptake